MKIAKRYLAPMLVIATLVVAGSACGDGGGSVSAFCDELQTFNEDLSLRDVNISEKERSERLATAFKELEADAPAEVKSEMKTLADFMVAIAEADRTDLEEINAATEIYKSGEIDAALDNFEEYVNDKCPSIEQLNI